MSEIQNHTEESSATVEGHVNRRIDKSVVSVPEREDFVKRFLNGEHPRRFHGRYSVFTVFRIIAYDLRRIILSVSSKIDAGEMKSIFHELKKFGCKPTELFDALAVPDVRNHRYLDCKHYNLCLSWVALETSFVSFTCSQCPHFKKKKSWGG